MTNNYEEYRQGHQPSGDTYQLWPLYGAGLENLGKEGQPISVPMPAFGPDELLVRHDACGLCFSDIKVIRLGQDHPRVYDEMQAAPVVLGHEVALTVVGVGEALRDQYQPGDRFILQADIFVDGVGYAYGYAIQGGLSQYNVLDQRVLNGDDGNYLIPLRETTGYAESALVEPWACVIAAYDLSYRDQLKDGGTAWFVGPDAGSFSLSKGFDAESHPARIWLTEMTGAFGDWLRMKAAELGIPVEEVAAAVPPEGEVDPAAQVDDLILLSPTEDQVEKLSPYLAPHGVLAFSAREKFGRKAALDVGRIHYNRWLFLGGTSADIAEIYGRAPKRSELKQGGRVMFVGAGGPMGRMHVQRAVETRQHPACVVCADVSEERLRDVDETFGADAAERGIDWRCVNPTQTAAYDRAMQDFEESGFDDVVMLVPIPAVISDAARWLAEGGVMNVFAGVARGTTAEIDLNDLAFRGVRIIGHSASKIEDMLAMLKKVEDGELATNRSVAAVGSLSAAKDGLQALIDAVYPGKVVIFPNIRELPLTAVADLKEVLPGVAARLKDGRAWTKEAEKAFLDEMAEDA